MFEYVSMHVYGLKTNMLHEVREKVFIPVSISQQQWMLLVSKNGIQL